MRGLRTDKTARVIIAGHAFMQNLRRGHYELAVDAPADNAGRGCVHRTRRSDLTEDPTRFNTSADPTTQQRPRRSPGRISTPPGRGKGGSAGRTTWRGPPGAGRSRVGPVPWRADHQAA